MTYGDLLSRWDHAHDRQHEEWLTRIGLDPRDDTLHRETVEFEHADRMAEYGPLPLPLRQEAQAQLDLYPSEARTVRRLPGRDAAAPGAATPEAA